MTTHRVGITATLVVLVAILGLGGCAKGAQLDTSKAEEVISEKLTAAYAPLDVGATTCPGNAKSAKGTTFVCSTEIGTSSVDVKVTVTDEKGNVEFVTTKAVIDIAKVQADLAAKLHAAYDEPGDVLKIAVDCGKPAVRVLKPHSSFVCEVTASAQVMAQEVTVEDTAGNLTYRAVEK